MRPAPWPGRHDTDRRHAKRRVTRSTHTTRTTTRLYHPHGWLTPQRCRFSHLRSQLCHLSERRGLQDPRQRQALSGHQYKRPPAHDLLRAVLRAAQIPVNIDPGLLPAAAHYAADVKSNHNRDVDGADIVTWARNRLVHPQVPRSQWCGIHGRPQQQPRRRSCQRGVLDLRLDHPRDNHWGRQVQVTGPSQARSATF